MITRVRFPTEQTVSVSLAIVVLSPRSCGSLTETARLLQNVRSVFSRRSATRNMELEMSREYSPHAKPRRGTLT